MLLTNWGLVVTWTDLAGELHNAKDEIYSEVYGETLTTKEVDLSGGTGLGNSIAKRCGKLVMLYVQLTFAAGEDSNSTSHRLPEGLRPVLTVDANDTYVYSNWPSGIRFFIRPNGFIQPVYYDGTNSGAPLPRAKTIRASVTYLLP